MGKEPPLDMLEQHIAEQTVAMVKVNDQLKTFCLLVPKVISDTQKIAQTFRDSLPGDVAVEMDKAAQKAISMMAVEVARLAQKVAVDAAASEKAYAGSRAAKIAAIGVIVGAIIFGGAGYLICMSMDYTSIAESKALLAAAVKRADDADTVAQNKISIAVSAANASSAEEIKKVKDMAGWVGTADGQFFLRHAKAFNSCNQFKWQIVKIVDGKKGCYVKQDGWFVSDILIGDLHE
jgi:hypothetical protein